TPSIAGGGTSSRTAAGTQGRSADGTAAGSPRGAAPGPGRTAPHRAGDAPAARAACGGGNGSAGTGAVPRTCSAGAAKQGAARGSGPEPAADIRPVDFQGNKAVSEVSSSGAAQGLGGHRGGVVADRARWQSDQHYARQKQRATDSR